ncbi:MAG: protein phosphatase 2C domain-containing protein [Clostridia bacterium]|nr:protein phosphatase 2C domain-containing protein [Clostridia bacterium]
MLKIDAITNTYKQHNEDAHGNGECFAWVMDGASALNKTNVTNWSNDVAWVVNWWTQYLNTYLKNTAISLHTILEQGILDLNREFSNFIPINQLSKLDRASSAIGITRIQDDMLECYVLGDVEIAIKFKSGVFKIVTDERIADLDATVIKMIAENKDRDQEISFAGYTEEELTVLRRNRMKMNAKDGYAILEHDPVAIKKGIYQRYPLHHIESVLLMSDGYSAIYNKYECFNLEELFKRVDTYGADDIIHQLRKKELENFDCCRRLRRHDDATGVYLKVK